jgi:hypothetical protein
VYLLTDSCNLWVCFCSAVLSSKANVQGFAHAALVKVGHGFMFGAKGHGDIFGILGRG